MKPLVLFVCKQRSDSWGTYSDQKASGLRNSVRQSVDMLRELGLRARAVDVVDNNGIDAVVARFKPSHVILEALWVVPDKLRVLRKLHRKVDWYVRLHSDLPFLAGEGIAMDWLARYTADGIATVAANSERMRADLERLYRVPIALMPNYYWMLDGRVPPRPDTGPKLDVGCFGAIRPLKNQLIQAVAAIEFARSLDRPLRFHINGSRVEGQGAAVLANLRGLFQHAPDAKLVEHPWLPHDRFRWLAWHMDVCMQASLSETFNIVTADAVDMGVPVVVSPEINWVSRTFQADPTSVPSLVDALRRAYMLRETPVNSLNRLGLRRHNRQAQQAWLEALGMDARGRV